MNKMWLRCRLHWEEINAIVKQLTPNLAYHQRQFTADRASHGGTISGSFSYSVIYNPLAGNVQPHKNFLDCGSGAGVLCNMVCLLSVFFYCSHDVKQGN